VNSEIIEAFKAAVQLYPVYLHLVSPLADYWRWTLAADSAKPCCGVPVPSRTSISPMADTET
jgi:hypothetical protein